DVTKHIADEVRSLRMRIQREPVGFVQKAQWAQIINSQKMICVSMGVEHRIERANVLANRLFTKVRRGVDDYRPPAVFNEYRRARSFVARIGRMANQAIAANRGHAH